LKTDPAFERWNIMREDVYKHFRFTPSVTRKVVLWAAIVPVTAWYIASQQDYKWDLAGKGKKESLLKHPPPPKPSTEESSA